MCDNIVAPEKDLFVWTVHSSHPFCILLNERPQNKMKKKKKSVFLPTLLKYKQVFCKFFIRMRLIRVISEMQPELIVGKISFLPYQRSSKNTLNCMLKP